MKVLMTGGTGLIGTRFMEQALSQNHYTVITRNPNWFKVRYRPNVQYVDSLHQYKDLNNFDVVINLAGEPIANKRWSKRQKNAICESRWQTTGIIAELLERSNTPPRVILSASAVGIYGKQDSTRISENFTEFNDDFSHQICKTWEEIAIQMSKYTRVCILRTGIVLDKYGGALKKMLPAFNWGLGGKMASGKQFMPWIHIEDMVSIMEFLIHTEHASGPFNLTAPEPVTNERFSKALAKTLNRPCFAHLPEPILKLLFGEMSELLIYGQNAVPEKLLKLGYQFKHQDLERALSHIINDKAV